MCKKTIVVIALMLLILSVSSFALRLTTIEGYVFINRMASDDQPDYISGSTLRTMGPYVEDTFGMYVEIPKGFPAVLSYSSRKTNVKVGNDYPPNLQYVSLRLGASYWFGNFELLGKYGINKVLNQEAQNRTFSTLLGEARFHFWAPSIKK